MKKMWIKKSKSFESAGQFDINYYLAMSPSERLGAMQLLREMLFKIKKGLKYERGGKGLRRVIKVIQ